MRALLLLLALSTLLVSCATDSSDGTSTYDHAGNRDLPPPGATLTGTHDGGRGYSGNGWVMTQKSR